MSFTTQSKNDYETNPHGFRTVSHFSGNYNCVNCYVHSYPCENCKLEPNNERKQYSMNYKEFMSIANPSMLVKWYGKIPETYKEYCDLHELYSNIPESCGYPEGCGPDCPDDCFNQWDLELKMDMSLEDIIKHEDPSYTLEGDQEVDGDDMGEIAESYRWGEMNDDEKREYLDYEIDEYLLLCN